MVSESAMRAILEFSCTSIITVLPKPCFLYLSDGISDKRSRLGPLLQWLPERALPREVRTFRARQRCVVAETVLSVSE